MTLLHRAAEMGSIETISKLLDAGVDIETRNNVGQTACHVAVRNGQLAALRLLLDRGANIFARNINGASLLDVALNFCHESLTLFLLDTGMLFDGNFCGLSGLSRASFAVLNRLLLEHFVDFASLRCTDRRTMLHLVGLNSSFADHLQNRLLFFVDSAHVDIDAKDMYGRTALYDVARNGQFGGHLCFDVLLALGINISSRDNNGGTICHTVARSNYLALCSCLAVGGSELLDQPDQIGQTPRMWASGSGVAIPRDADVDGARRRISRIRLDFVRDRALQVCIGLQSLGLDALQTCEILLHSCGYVASLIDFHQWWAIATLVKHFRRE